MDDKKTESPYAGYQYCGGNGIGCIGMRMARAKAVLAGANVIMPNITTVEMRKNYQLYEGKSGVKDDAESTKLKLERQMDAIGVKIGWFDIGNPGKFL